MDPPIEWPVKVTLARGEEARWALTRGRKVE